MINAHDIKDFQSQQLEDGHVFATFPSVTANGPAPTRIEMGYNEARNCLCLHQEQLGGRAELDEDDMVVLDETAQSILYMILKLRFEG
jgi:hypothetical protein